MRNREGPTARPTGVSNERLFWTAAVIGALLPFPVALLALVWRPAEAVAPLLTPGLVLLAPLGGVTAGWPALVTVLLASAANGLVAGVGALLVRRVWGMLRR
ncbi:hypothetical protein [Aquipuribacter sp. SD81]|uniref:hypothetical protein n=1 Tax=Aquipuribacter sp. SD81 TaxID=3127703 RepID=UPI003019F36E